MTILLSAAYFSVLFFFGWQAARWILNENRIEHLIAFAGVFGIGLYVFFVNIAGLFIPIQIVFYLVASIFLLFASALFFCRRFQIFGDQRPLELGLNARWRKVLLGSALFLTLSVGFISFCISLSSNLEFKNMSEIQSKAISTCFLSTFAQKPVTSFEVKALYSPPTISNVSEIFKVFGRFLVPLKNMCSKK